MQPYLFPYPGYFRLLAAADCFVVLDCVQFNRRGRVHRAQMPTVAGSVDWLTLPLARQPREVLIRDLAFADDARARFDRCLRRFPGPAGVDGTSAERLQALLRAPFGRVVDFLEEGLRLVADVLGFRPPQVRSSSLPIDPALRGQDRIIAIVQALGGREYLNAPGGRHLYDGARFADAGLKLSFLSPYTGRHPFLLPALLQAGPAALRADVLDTLAIESP